MPGHLQRFLALVFALRVFVDVQASEGSQPNPPEWTEGVYVWGPETPADEITQVVTDAFTTNGGHVPEDHGQFSPKRFAFMFKPGTYHVDVPIGFYTQVLGLGEQPGDVVFEAARGPYSEEGDQEHMGGSLRSFWRSAENFRTRSDMLWAVSQAAPMRRIIADKDLTLAQYIDGVGMGFASGGFVGNVEVGGQLFPGSQQQFCVRNGNFVGGWSGGVWNMVFIGSQNAPEAHCGHDGGFPFVTVEKAPIIAEKPFVSIDEQGRFYLNVPGTKTDRVGTDFEPGLQVPFEKVYVAREGDTAAVINEHLTAGLHLVIPPGIWELDAPLELNTEGQVLLGLGLATLVSTSGNDLIRVGNVDGVRVAGILLEAGETMSETLLQWGDGTYKGNPENPGFAHDLFARVGGPDDPTERQTQSRVMVQISSGNVVGDNFWLWRADHWGKPTGEYGLVKNGDNRCDTGLVVTGDDVIMYGLAVEHTLKDMVQWSGQGGRVFFFQSELPYDVNEDWADAGYVGYHVMDNVVSHEGHGIGVYHFFRDYAVTVQTGIACPEWLENSFVSPLGVYLSGKGKMLHVMNTRGDMTAEGEQVQWICEKGLDVAVPANPPTVPPRPLDDVTPVVVRVLDDEAGKAEEPTTEVTFDQPGGIEAPEPPPQAPEELPPAPESPPQAPEEVWPAPESPQQAPPAPESPPQAPEEVWPAPESPQQAPPQAPEEPLPLPESPPLAPEESPPAPESPPEEPATAVVAEATEEPIPPVPQFSPPAELPPMDMEITIPQTRPWGRADAFQNLAESLGQPGKPGEPAKATLLAGRSTPLSLEQHGGSGAVSWWTWVIPFHIVALMVMAFLLYAYFGHRRPAGKPQGAGDGPGSPLFQGLPCWSPGAGHAGARGVGSPPQGPASPSPYAAWAASPGSAMRRRGATCSTPQKGWPATV